MSAVFDLSEITRKFSIFDRFRKVAVASTLR